jgi:two-component system, chemotaxis family, chemotaxis protein CheY
MKCLVVDDSPTMRRIVIKTIRSIGSIEAVEAEDGMDGLNRLRDGKFDFVITEWNMPNMTGIELVKTIRKDSVLKDLPILMVSSKGLKEDIIEALKAKVNYYVVKPFTNQVLKEKIELILKSLNKIS